MKVKLNMLGSRHSKLMLLKVNRQKAWNISGRRHNNWEHC